MDELELQIDSLAYHGAGIAHTKEGKVVFVSGTAPGDVVHARITKDQANYAQAELLKVLQDGPARVAPACAYAPLCGGCQWQHVSYPQQCQAKRASVVSALSHMGDYTENAAENLVGECVASPQQLGYRNKLELACRQGASGRLELGLYATGSQDFIGIERCPLACAASQNAPQALQGALRYLEGTSNLGLFRVGVRYSVQTASCEVALWTTPGAFPRAAAAKTISSALPATSVVRVVAGTGKARKVKSVEALHGAGNWHEKLGRLGYWVSAPSFFQVNTSQAKALQQLVLEGLRIEAGMRIADLYAGVGTFGLALAASGAQVVAVESSGAAVRDLQRNAQKAGLSLEVQGGSAERQLPTLGKLDALVVDPPRAGLAAGVAESIAAAAPQRLAYVSCNPATWARDVVRLNACGYSLKQATPVDMFPQTYHVETVSIFERNT